MAFTPIVNEVVSRQRRKLGAAQCYAELKAESLGGESISKALSVNVSLNLTQADAAPAGAEAVIAVNATILLLTDAGEIMSVQAKSECVCKIAAGGLASGQKVLASPSLIEISNIKISGPSLSCQVLIECGFSVIAEEKIRCAETTGEGMFVKSDSFVYSDAALCKSENFEHAYELDLPSGVLKVLSLESSVMLAGAEAASDLITITGSVVNNLIYLTNDEVPKLKNQIHTTDFRQEILAAGCSAPAQVFAEIYSGGAEFNVLGELSSGKAVLAVKNRVNANVICNEDKALGCIKDAYSTSHHLQLTTESYTRQSAIIYKKHTDKVDGNIILGEEAQRIDKILCGSAAYAVLTAITPSDGKLDIEGVLYANVLYLSEDDAGGITSVRIEVPFSSSFGLHEITAHSVVDITAVVAEVDARNKKGREIDVQADIVFNVNLYRPEQGAVISNVAQGEAKPQTGAALGVYLIHGASEAWDAAKQLNVDPQVLSEFNPELMFPSDGTQSAVIYRKRNV
ncbi:MAG: DUF3794 domain-containing protein [Firmicutes bacterium]|nr:DUF3794 domain-containing protein [Bacillota bacterium]